MLRALLIALVVTLALAHVAAAGTWSAVSVPRTEDLARVGRIRAGSSVAVDDNGNLTDDGRRFFFYDYKNRLVAVTDKQTAAPIAAYEYLADGRRAKKTVWSGAVASETRSYWDGAQEVEEVGPSGTTTYVWSPVYVDELVTYTNSLGTFYTHQDARCDVVAITNAAGVVVERVRYDDFGKAEIRSALGFVVPQSAVGCAYGFQGRKLDAETGLLYFRARYYDPETGRFLQRDPVWDAGNVGGQYTFCGNGPVSGRDPGGLQTARADDRFEGPPQGGLFGTFRHGHSNPGSPPSDGSFSLPSIPPKVVGALQLLGGGAQPLKVGGAA